MLKAQLSEFLRAMLLDRKVKKMERERSWANLPQGKSMEKWIEIKDFQAWRSSPGRLAGSFFARIVSRAGVPVRSSGEYRGSETISGRAFWDGSVNDSILRQLKQTERTKKYSVGQFTAENIRSASFPLPKCQYHSDITIKKHQRSKKCG